MSEKPKTISLSGETTGDSCCPSDNSQCEMPKISGDEIEIANDAAICDLTVGGMDCPSCADDIKRALGKLEGIEDIRVDVVGGKVKIAYADGKLSRGDLAGAIRRVGYKVEDGSAKKASFIVNGMDCADEVRQIEDKLGRLPGVTNLGFDLINRRLKVEGAITSAEVQRAIKEIGMTARAESEEQKQINFWEHRGRLIVTIISGIFLVLGVGFEWLKISESLVIPFLAISIISGGWFIAPRGFRAARNLALDMNFLMTVAAIGAPDD